MKHSARAIIRRAEIPLLAVIVLYKAATNLLFVPLMQQLWSLTLRFAPMHYLSNNNASDIFSSPAIILCITLIAILTAFWALYEFSVLLHGLDLARQGETLRLAAELSQNVVQTFGFTRVLLQADDGQAAEIRYVRYESQSGAGWSCSVTF